MDKVTVYDYLTKTVGLTDEEYIYWQKLTHDMTSAARMMGLVENKMTTDIFRKALANLMDFETSHNMQFYELGVTLANISGQINA